MPRIIIPTGCLRMPAYLIYITRPIDEGRAHAKCVYSKGLFRAGLVPVRNVPDIRIKLGKHQRTDGFLLVRNAQGKHPRRSEVVIRSARSYPLGRRKLSSGAPGAMLWTAQRIAPATN